MSRRSTSERYAVLRQSWWRHRDVATLSRGACGVYALGLSYCSDNLSDGHIPEGIAIKMLADGHRKLIAELVDAKWWHETEKGFLVVAYLDHNLSKQEMDDRLNAKRKAGAKGGRSKASAVAAATHVPDVCLIQPDDNGTSKTLLDLDSDRDLDRETTKRTPSVVDLLNQPPTPAIAWRLLEAISALHTQDGRPVAIPGVVHSANDMTKLAALIAAAGPDPLGTIAAEWLALLSLIAAGETEAPRGPMIPYFAARFGRLEADRVEARVDPLPAREAA